MLSGIIRASEPPKTVLVDGQILYVFTEEQTRNIAAALISLDIAERRVDTLNALVDNYEKALATMTAISAQQDLMLKAEVSKREALEREQALSRKALRGGWVRKVSSGVVTVVVAVVAGALLAQ